MPRNRDNQVFSGPPLEPDEDLRYCEQLRSSSLEAAGKRRASALRREGGLAEGVAFGTSHCGLNFFSEFLQPPKQTPGTISTSTAPVCSFPLRMDFGGSSPKS
ncbi:uncharacterized protein ACIQIH_005973 [Cyanocitta cristata]